MGMGNFGGKEAPIVKYKDFLPSAVQNGLSDRLVVLVVDLGGPKEAHVQSYSSADNVK